MRTGDVFTHRDLLPREEAAVLLCVLHHHGARALHLAGADLKEAPVLQGDVGDDGVVGEPGGVKETALGTKLSLFPDKELLPLLSACVLEAVSFKGFLFSESCFVSIHTELCFELGVHVDGST